MVLNATFNNMSVTSWWSILLVEETGENHRPDASRSLTLSHVLSSTPSLSEIRTHNEAHLEIDKVCTYNKKNCNKY
jgi:hypothetical protein